MPTEGRGPYRSIRYDVDLTALHRSDPKRYPALIESAAADSDLGRYDILFAFPSEKLVLEPEGTLTGERAIGNTRFLDAFDDWWRELRTERTKTQSPFTGGWFVMLGFELANEIEPSLGLRVDGSQPVAVALRIPVAVIRDRRCESAWIVAEPGHETAVETLLADLATTDRFDPEQVNELVLDGLHEDDPQQFLTAVDSARSHIAAGDIYQANLARRWTGRLRSGVTPADVYCRLKHSNPAPFAGIAALPGITIVSSSPERLLRSDGRWVETRPIAGTRPRNRDESDARLREELQANPKERAEHVMLLDLERNDLGRICRGGSVEVDEFMVIETYAHVHHIVSNVRGELRDDATPGTIIRSVFPGGSITGCPKVRCMQIIGELETCPRGIYTGAMGYINRDGSADLNILIRTIAITGDEVSVATGSGIVADSDPLQELEETRAKARGMLLALGAIQAEPT